MDEKQQLIAGNAMLRYMAKIADPENKLEGYKKVSSYLEAGDYLEDQGLLVQGVDMLKSKDLHMKPIIMNNLKGK
jgi:hypothetical protein